MRLPLPAALAIALSATACATSSPPAPPPADLAAAQARAQAAVEHPQLPPVLQLCQDGTAPWTEGAEDALTYRCPMPPDLKAALDGGLPMDVVAAKAIGDLQKETDLRFQANHWNDHPHGVPAAAEAAPAAKQDAAPPWWRLW